MKRCLSAPPKRAQEVTLRPEISPAQCSICRSLFASYSADMQKQQNKSAAAFVHLLAHDLNVEENHEELGLCRFHDTYHLRLDILRYVVRGVSEGQRFDALYSEVARLDLAAERESARFLRLMRETVWQRQMETVVKVRKALMSEQRSLTDFWKAQVEDIDANISQSIMELENRQAQELVDVYEKFEKTYEGSRPHFSNSLLELWNQEPRLCKARAFDQARTVISLGKQEEKRQKRRFLEGVERQKSLKMSWKVSQQMKQLNGIVDKMHRHRRQQEASREQECTRLASRVKAALQRLQRDQREELRKLHHFLLQHCFRIRHMVETHSRTDREESPERKPLHTARHDVSFVQPVNTTTGFPRSANTEFVNLICSSAETPKKSSFPAFVSPVSEQDQEINALLYSKEERPRSAQPVSSQKNASCDWCGKKCNAPCILWEESDPATGLLRNMDSYNLPMAVSIQSIIDQEPNATPIPGPKGIPDSRPETAKNRKHPDKKVLLSSIMDYTKPKKALTRCCSWNCVNQWNQKYSPPYLRGRRNLSIELSKSRRT